MTNENQSWQPLRELAAITPYTMGYLSLMARRNQLKVKKIGRIWYSTLDNIREFEKEMKERKEQRKRELSVRYKEVAGGKNREIEKYLPAGRQGEIENKGYRLRVAEDSIFDEVQRELNEVLDEIRGKEREIRMGLTTRNAEHVTRNIQSIRDEERGMRDKGIRLDPRVSQGSPEDDRGVSTRGETQDSGLRDKDLYLEQEREQTEEISEKLVRDLGRLLNTANEVHEKAEEEALNHTVQGGPYHHTAQGEAVLEDSAEWVPVNIHGKNNIGNENKKYFGIADPFYYTGTQNHETRNTKYETPKLVQVSDLNQKTLEQGDSGQRPEPTHGDSHTPPFGHPSPEGTSHEPRATSYHSDNFLSVPYNAHPFDYASHPNQVNSQAHLERRSKVGQIFLVIVALLMIVVAGVLVAMALFM